MKHKTRTLQYKPYSVTAEDEWSWVIAGLNGEGLSGDPGDWTSAATTRVSSLVLAMKELDEIRATLRDQPRRDSGYVEPFEWPHFVFKRVELQKLNERGRELTLKVNAQLAFYKWSPSIFTNNFKEFQGPPCWNARSESDYQESVAVHSILDELSAGRIDRFRLCRHCTRWFYAVAQHQVSCSESCRKKHASTSDDFKAKRRDYMKKYRKQEQSRNKQAKIQVKTQTKAR